MKIANYTPDTMEWWHVGINGFLKPGDVQDFDGARGNHILNHFGRRGLVQMQFGDDPEVKKQAAMAAWESFWEGQITAHNRINEDRKANKALGPLPPTKELEEKAKILGLELIKPWRVESPKDESKEIAELKAENARLSTQMDQLLKLFTAQQNPATVSNDAEKALSEKVEANRNKYKRLGESNMKAFVSKNWEDIQQMPEENRFELKTKYEEIYQTPFPVEKPE